MAAGTELPDRRYYLEPRFAPLRQHYLQHIGGLAALMGVTINPAAVLAIETDLATADLPRSARRDPRALHHPMTFDELQADDTALPLAVYLEGRGIAGADTVNVVLPSYLVALDELLGRRSLEELKSYLRWQLIEDKAGLLNQVVLYEEFSFHNREFSGVSEPQPRDWTCYLQTTGGLGFTLAKQYVDRFLTRAPASKDGC